MSRTLKPGSPKEAVNGMYLMGRGSVVSELVPQLSAWKPVLLPESNKGGGWSRGRQCNTRPLG